VINPIEEDEEHKIMEESKIWKREQFAVLEGSIGDFNLKRI